MKKLSAKKEARITKKYLLEQIERNVRDLAELEPRKTFNVNIMYNVGGNQTLFGFVSYRDAKGNFTYPLDLGKNTGKAGPA